MRSFEDINAKREQAYALQGWTKDGQRTALDGADLDRQEKDRAYAEGVEAGLLFALGDAGDPFPR